MTPRSSRASGPSPRNIGEARETSIVAPRLPEYCARRTPVRCLPHSLVSLLVSHLLCWATVASRVMESGWKSSSSTVDQVRLLAVLVNAIECVRCGRDRQRRDLEGLATGGDDGDSGGDAETNVAEPRQFIHIGVDLLRVRPLWIENRFGIFEDYERLLRGQEWS